MLNEVSKLMMNSPITSDNSSPTAGAAGGGMDKRKQSFLQRANTLLHMSPLTILNKDAHGIPILLTRFYMASVVLALSHMHTKNIAYRNLCGENIMIGSDGYIRLVGFSLAKKYPYIKSQEQNNKSSGAISGSYAVLTSGSYIPNGSAVSATSTAAVGSAVEADDLSERPSTILSKLTYLKTAATDAIGVKDEKIAAPLLQYRSYTLCGSPGIDITYFMYGMT